MLQKKELRFKKKARLKKTGVEKRPFSKNQKGCPEKSTRVSLMKELKKKQNTKELILELKRASRERKEKVWKDIASRLSKPSRQLARVNIEKISKEAAKNRGKVLVVPGKVLSKGELGTGATVSALTFSSKAREKLGEKGKALTLRELVESKTKAGEIVIVL